MKLIMENWRKFINEENPTDKIDAMLRDADAKLDAIRNKPRTVPEPKPTIRQAQAPNVKKSPQEAEIKVNWKVESRFVRNEKYRQSVIIVSIEDLDNQGQKIEFKSNPIGSQSSHMAHHRAKKNAYVMFIKKYMPQIKAYGNYTKRSGPNTPTTEQLTVRLDTGELKTMIIPSSGLRY